MGGFIALTVQWLWPRILHAVSTPLTLTSIEIARISTISDAIISMLVGAYLFFWSVKTSQSTLARVALAIAGIISLHIVYVVGVMALAGLGR
jgi:hypothetical protein